MVLFLTSVNNKTNRLELSRQYKANQSDGQPLKGLDDTTGHIQTHLLSSYFSSDFDRSIGMEIERYHNAFPALEATARSDTLDHVSILQCDNQPRKTAVKKKQQTSSKLNGTTSQKSGVTAYQRNGHSGKVLHKYPHQSLNYKNSKQNGKHPNKNRFAKPKKSERFSKKNSDERMKFKNTQLKDSKPWKCLPDIVESLSPCNDNSCNKLKADIQSNEAKSEEFISADLLNSLLQEDSFDKIDVETARSLWDGEEKSAENQTIWKFGLEKSLLSEPSTWCTRNHELTGCIADQTSASSIDATDDEGLFALEYDEIQQSLNCLKVCEDVPNEYKQSKFLPLFRENPFSYMMQHSEFNEGNLENPLSTQMFKCKHCLESYEIVLDSEVDGFSKTSKIAGKTEIYDSRLDFDWFKYHPPPWSADSTKIEKASVKIGGNPKTGCDCEFCRYQIWKNICHHCSTPL